MEVILLQNIEKLGRSGDVVKVKDGYARNFLIPKKFAIPVSKGALRVLEEKKRSELLKAERRRKEALLLAEKLSRVSINIPVESGRDDMIFGALTTEMVSKALKGEGVDIDRKKIILPEDIKKLGMYSIEVVLHPEVKTKLKLWVVKK